MGEPYAMKVARTVREGVIGVLSLLRPGSLRS